MKHGIKTGLVILVLCFLTACQKKEELPKEGTYNIYYLNSAMTKLVPHEFYTSETDPEKLISDLMEQFLTVPKDVDSQVALPTDKVSFQGHWQEGMVLYLYFDNNYTSKAVMSSTREVLCRAALTKTMTQIEGIDYIYIYSGDQSLLDASGNAIGMMSSADFQESISDVNSFEKTELILYFTDQTGEQLVEEKQEVVHNINTSLERLIVEQLIKGPEQKTLYPTLPKDVKLLNISVTENICYLNLDTSFMTSNLDVRDYIPIYSIVNSLVNLPTVNRVQISINGSQDVMFRDTISLKQPLERNLELGGEEY